MKVYIAGSSAELERVDRCAARAHAAGLFVVSTWPVSVRNVGHANPRGAVRSDRQRWSLNCLAEIQLADVVWLLVPAIDQPTRGAWLELGYAIRAGKGIVCSGDTMQSIFASLGAEFESDDAALAFLIDHAAMFARSSGVAS
jgi:nucleoside 2-deoxyribosyltransferase